MGSLFIHYDTDNSNTIEAPEFRKLCLELGYFFKEDEQQQIFNIIDEDHSGTIEFEEFWKFWETSNRFRISNTHQLKLYREALVQFKRYDLDGNGKISLDEYKEINKSAGWNKTDDELKAAIAALDIDGDGEISF